jgi:hypothetical protein
VHCTDESVIGAEFYVMERVKGIILRSELPPNWAWMPRRPKPVQELHRPFVELHRSTTTPAAWPTWASLKATWHARSRLERPLRKSPDPRRAALGSGQSLAQRQDAGRPPDLQHRPQRLPLRQRDPRPDNPMQIIGVLDWELTTLGDPLMDLGNTLAYWIEAGDPAPVQLMRRQPSNAPGMLTRREFVDYYAERSGIRSTTSTSTTPTACSAWPASCSRSTTASTTARPRTNASRSSFT